MEAYLLFMIGSATLSGVALAIQRLTLTSLGDKTIHEIIEERGKPLIPTITNKWWLISVFIAMGAWVLNVQALKDADLSLVKPLVNLNVIVVIIITWLVKRERLTKLEGLGIGITLIGAIILSTEPLSKESDFDMAIMILFGFIIGILFLSAIILAYFIQKKHIPLAISTGLMYGLIAALTNAVVILEAPSISKPLTFIELVLSVGFWLILILTVFAFGAMQAALALGKGGVVTAISDGLSISIATFSAVIVFTENVGIIRIIGIILITGGAILLHQVSEQEYTSLNNEG